MIEKKKIFHVKQAFVKAQNYCAANERCQQDVRTKLYDWGLWKNDVENIIAQLISENFINEERYAIAFAGGKFRIKNWGRKKIINELKRKNISEYCINKALKEINTKDYSQLLKKLIEKKGKNLKEKNPIKANYKIANYLIGKGYEAEMVWEELNKLKKDKK